MTGRWTYRGSAAGVLVLAAAAFTLSYDALHQLALDSRVRPALAWLWPVVIDGTIVVALLTVLAAKRAATRAAYAWALAGLFSLASVAFNIAHAPDRPVAQLVFAMAPGRPGAHHPPAHAAGRLAAADARPERTPGRTAGRPRTRTSAQDGRRPHTPAAPPGSGLPGRRSGQGPGSLRGSGPSRPDPNRCRPGPGRGRERAVRAKTVGGVHGRPGKPWPSERRPPGGCRPAQS
jgi:hypothetical protein